MNSYQKLHSVISIPVTICTIFTLLLHSALSFGRYVQFQSCVYTTDDAYHTSLSSTADYGKSGTIRNCNKMIRLLDGFLHRPTIKQLSLNRLSLKHVTSPMYTITSIPSGTLLLRWDRFHRSQTSFGRYLRDYQFVKPLSSVFVR